jgi:hypothetical protein
MENEEPKSSNRKVNGRWLLAVLAVVIILSIVLVLRFCGKKLPKESEVAIPTQTLPAFGASPDPNSKLPTIVLGAPQQLPDGPASFDVSDVGDLVIADTIQSRLLILDADGRYKKKIALPFSPLRVLWDRQTNRFIVEDKDTGAFSSVTDSGQVTQTETTLDQVQSFDALEDVQKIHDHSADVLVRNFEARGNVVRTLELCKAPDVLLTVRSLGIARNDIFYVDVEIASRGNVDDTHRFVIRYDLGRKRISAQIPVDATYFYIPQDTVRVTPDAVYQFVPSEHGIVIKRWRTN